MSSMRDQMPQCAAFIDSLRAEFGAAGIDKKIKERMQRGEFWAIEKGVVLGKPPRDQLIKAGLLPPEPSAPPLHSCVVCAGDAGFRFGDSWVCTQHYCGVRR